MAIKAQATQEFVPIEEVRDGIIAIKGGEMRAIIIASSLNFSLKSEDEKTAILLQFQDFLNSLDFSIQIFVESRRLDIRPYIALLEEQKKIQTNDLMRIQVQEYIGFIKSFTETTNIMTKGFFIVIPYSPAVLQGKAGAIGSFLSKKNPVTESQSKEVLFEENRTQLEQRLSIVEQGLMRCGIRTERLGTDEVIELFYKLFNPGDTEKPISTQ